jgi:hypothetical protein
METLNILNATADIMVAPIFSYCVYRFLLQSLDSETGADCCYGCGFLLHLLYSEAGTDFSVSALAVFWYNYWILKQAPIVTLLRLLFFAIIAVFRNRPQFFSYCGCCLLL